MREVPAMLQRQISSCLIKNLMSCCSARQKTRRKCCAACALLFLFRAGLVTMCGVSLDSVPSDVAAQQKEWAASPLAKMLMERRAKRPRVVQQVISGWLTQGHAGNRTVHSSFCHEENDPGAVRHQRSDCTVLPKCFEDGGSQPLATAEQTGAGGRRCWEISPGSSEARNGGGALLGAVHIAAYTTQVVARQRLRTGTPVRLRRPRMDLGGGEAGRRKRSPKRPPSNTIIRFSLAADRDGCERPEEEVGRLPSSECAVLAPLIDQGWLSVEGVVCEAAARDESGASVGIDVRVAVTEQALGQRCSEATRQQVRSLMHMLGMREVDEDQVQRDEQGEGETGRRSEAVAPRSDGDGASDANGELSKGAVLGAEHHGVVLRAELRAYQREGVEWMRRREEGEQHAAEGAWSALWERWQGVGAALYVKRTDGSLALSPPPAGAVRGGILADEMGLGKTVQVLGLLAAAGLRSGGGEGGTLVVCPVSILEQWEAEARRHLRSTQGSLRVLTHHSAQRQDRQALLAADLVLTTYGVLVADFVRAAPARARRPARSGEAGEERGVGGVVWSRVVLDEGQVIKHKETLVSRAAWALRGARRWVVTGTPLENSVHDCFALLRFLGVQPWGDADFWARRVTQPWEEGAGAGAATAMAAVRRTMSGLLLRRTKQHRDAQGRPLIQLPLRSERVARVRLSAGEQEVYQRVLEEGSSAVRGLVAGELHAGAVRGVLELLLRLRQACAHPSLLHAGSAALQRPRHSALQSLEKRLLAAAHAEGEGQPPEAAASRLRYIRELMAGARAGRYGDCPICLEAVSEPVLTLCGHLYCRPCLRSLLAAEAGAASAGRRGRCPACRSELRKGQVLRLPPDGTAEPLPSAAEASAKIAALMECLRESAGEKAVVFSQWSALLELVAAALRREGRRFARYDGSMSVEQRSKALAEVRRSDGAEVLLMTLKAGGLGLNLCCCRRVFILDPAWNPQVEEQAVARVHRLGQEAPVVRFIAEGTVEERMLRLHSEKRSLFLHAFPSADDDVGPDLGPLPFRTHSLRIQELAALFRDALEAATGKRE